MSWELGIGSGWELEVGSGKFLLNPDCSLQRFVVGLIVIVEAARAHRVEVLRRTALAGLQEPHR